MRFRGYEVEVVPKIDCAQESVKEEEEDGRNGHKAEGGEFM